MSIDPEDGLLNDYLDERLDAAARGAFEARIARDPALARRVELGREIRRALRADGDEPSPAFYARARERFEAGTRRPWFRPPSWEAAGLAVAAMVVAAVFVPGLLRRDELLLQAPERPSSPPQAEPQQAPQPSGELRAEPPAAPGAKDEPAAPRPVVGREKKEVAAPRHDDSSAKKKDEGASRQLADEFAPAPETAPEPPAGARAAPEERRQEFGFLGKSSAEQAPAATGGNAQAVTADDAKASAPEPIAIPLRAGIVGRGEVRTIDSREAWLDLRVPESDLPPPSADRVLILIGPREAPFACAPIAVVPRDGARVIELRALAAGERESPGGCAVVLPRAGLPVRVVGPGAGP